MIDILKEFFQNIMKSRILPLMAGYLLIAFILVYKVFTIQVVKKEIIVDNKVEDEVFVREIKPTRGNIYDCNGVLLATNRLSYNIVMTRFKPFETNDAENEMIHKLVKIIEGNGGKLFPEFYIEKNKKGKLSFTVSGAAELRFKRDAFTAKSIDELTIEQKNATAEEVYEHLRKGKYMFGISDKYNLEETLKIMKIRFALLLNTYNKNPISISTNVNEKTVAAVKEYSYFLPGVEVVGHTYRVYHDSAYFSHIIGYTGSVNDDEMAGDKDKYYTSFDQIGKTGLEYSFERYLRGKKGIEETTVNNRSDISDIKVITKPHSGDDIYLTIDSKLQKACYHILEKDLASVLLSRIHNSASAGEKGRNASKIMIPIYDVYYAFFNNNKVNFELLSKKNASKIEKQVFDKYIKKKNQVLKRLKQIVSVNSTVNKKEAGEELAEYLDYFYSFLKKEQILNYNSIDKEDWVVKKFSDDNKSLSEFIKYAISKRWINLGYLGIGTDYLSTEEIFNKIVEEIFEATKNDSNFIKMIFKSLIYGYELSGTEVCLLLYDQGYFKKDKETYDKLYRGELSAYGFIRSKIKSLAIKPSDLALDPCSGSMVITEPKTGRVRAMVTYPTYDNNKLANQINPEYYFKIQSDLSYPLINRPCQQKTAPGSTFKPVSGIAALQTGSVGLRERIRANVVFDKTDKPAKCWSSFSHGNIDLTDALEVSCNYFFYEAGYRMSLDADGKYVSKLGLEKINDYAAKFGFEKGTTSGVELYEYEPSISYTDSVRSSIGQGSYAFTPTQIARYMSAIANRGTLNYLTLIDHIENLEGKKVKNTISKAINKKAGIINLPKEYWDSVHQGLYKVIYGSRSSFPGMFDKVNTTVAGKSGTAEFSEQRGNHALFTSYAPFQDPKLCVTVVLPFAYVSANAAKVTADFYEYYFGEKDIEDIVNQSADENFNIINAD